MEKEEKIKKQKEFLIKAAYWSVWAFAVYAGIRLLGSALLPFFLAFLLAWMLSKPVDFLTEKTGMKRGVFAFFVVAFFFAALCGLFYLIGASLCGVVKRCLTAFIAILSGTVLPALLSYLSRFEQMAGSRETLVETGELLSELSGNLVGYVSGAASCIPEICMNVFLVVIATILMELEFPSLAGFLRRWVPEKWQEYYSEKKAGVKTSIRKYILSYVIIFCMTFAELFAGLLLLGADGAAVLAFLIALLDILPVLGTGTVLLPWCLISFASGSVRRGAGLLALYLVITLVRNLVEPRLVGKQMGLSPAVMLPCLLIGYQLFGVIGFLLLPVGFSVLKELYDDKALRQ